MKITNHGVTLNFEQRGSGPAIVFIHDSKDNQAIHAPSFSALTSAGFKIVVTNLRDFLAHESATIDDLSNDAITLLNYLGIGRAVIFGVGRGSCVLLNLLERQPERIAGSSIVIPPEMAERLHQFAGRNALVKALKTESAAPLIRELFNTVPATTSTTYSLTTIPTLKKWLMQTGKLSSKDGATGLALLAKLKLPLILIDKPTTAAGRRWRQNLGGRLRAFNNSLLALLDLLVPGEGEEFDEENLGESH